MDDAHSDTSHTELNECLNGAWRPNYRLVVLDEEKEKKEKNSSTFISMKVVMGPLWSIILAVEGVEVLRT
jgi:hypothetical protein